MTSLFFVNLEGKRFIISYFVQCIKPTDFMYDGASLHSVLAYLWEHRAHRPTAEPALACCYNETNCILRWLRMSLGFTNVLGMLTIWQSHHCVQIHCITKWDSTECKQECYQVLYSNVGILSSKVNNSINIHWNVGLFMADSYNWAITGPKMCLCQCCYC